MTERKAFKDYFDADTARELAELLGRGFPSLDVDGFVRTAARDLDDLEMMDRVRQFSATMRSVLPADKRETYAGLSRALPEPLPTCEDVTDGYVLWPVGEFIAESYSSEMSSAEIEAALDCMEQLTQRFTAEFAVRPFLAERSDLVLPRLLALTEHPSPHVRRWCSEATRSRLPWGKRLNLDRSQVLEVLEKLRSDPERYVQKSVANNLNDLAKDDPDLVLDTCARWLKQASVETRWIVGHGLRSLVKDGDRRALELMGFPPPRQLTCDLAVSPETITIGESTVLELTVFNRSEQEQQLLVDYLVHYQKASGKVSAKVFKWTTLNVAASEKTLLKKTQPFRHVSIRRLFPGEHLIEVQVNGTICAGARLFLEK